MGTCNSSINYMSATVGLDRGQAYCPPWKIVANLGSMTSHIAWISSLGMGIFTFCIIRFVSIPMDAAAVSYPAQKKMSL